MNQKELNRIAENYILTQSIQVAKKLDETLTVDLLLKSKEHNGPTIHHIHNLALFNCLVKLNSMFQLDSDSKEAISEYYDLVENQKPKFMEIIETLKDFQPSERQQYEK